MFVWLRDIFLCAIVDAVYWRRRFQGKGCGGLIRKPFKC